MKGIYKYTDLKNDEIVYIGKDSHIDKNRRHKAHLSPSKYDDQPINRILQNNPDRYEYDVIWATDDCTTLKLNKMEILFGKIYDPKFNYGKYGVGGRDKGFKHTEATKQKISENNGRYWEGKTLSDETKKKMSLAQQKKILSMENKIDVGKSRNTSGIFRVSKHKDKKCKQGFRWRYQYVENGKVTNITRVSLDELEKEIKSRGLPWIKIDGGN